MKAREEFEKLKWELQRKGNCSYPPEWLGIFQSFFDKGIELGRASLKDEAREKRGDVLPSEMESEKARWQHIQNVVSGEAKGFERQNSWNACYSWLRANISPTMPQGNVKQVCVLPSVSDIDIGSGEYLIKNKDHGPMGAPSWKSFEDGAAWAIDAIRSLNAGLDFRIEG